MVTVIVRSHRSIVMDITYVTKRPLSLPDLIQPGAVFPTGGIGATQRGAQKNAPSKKKKKQELWVFFCAPFYISNQYFDIKKNSNIRVKLAKNRKRKGYVRPCCCQNMQAQ